MRQIRTLLTLTLALLVAVPGPAAAQVVRVAVGTPLTGAPTVSAPVPLAPPVGVLSAVPAPLAASIAFLPAPTAVPETLAPRALLAAVASAPNVGEKSADGASSEERKAGADAAFDGAMSQGALTTAAAPAAAPAPLAAAGLDRRLSTMGRVPAPRPWLDKAGVLLAYGGMTAASVALNSPFEHLGPMIVGAILSPMLSFMGLFFYAASQSAVEGASLDGEGVKPAPETMAMITRLAAEAKVGAPARVNVMPGAKVQAQVGMPDKAGYEIRFTKALESLRPEVQEAILRHEFAHRRHHDVPWQIVQIFLAPLAPMIGMMALQGKSAPEIMAFAAITAAAALLLPASLRRSEYLADQYAASKPEGAGPIARFFIEDSENRERAAAALSGTAFASETGWKRRAVSSWDWAKNAFSSHPSHDQRVARLARLVDRARP